MIGRWRSFLSGRSGSRADKGAPSGESSPAELPEILQTPENRFWNWFVRNRAFIETIRTDTDRVIDSVQARIALISRHIVFEIGQSADGRYEFIVSTGGIKKLIPHVTRLYNAAPQIENWRIIAFKPRHATPMIEYGGQRFNLSDFYYASQKGEDGKIDVNVYIRGYNMRQEKIFGMVGFLFLDTVLGEYDVMTNIGAIEFGDIPPGPMTISGIKPLKDLAPEVDSHKSAMH